MPPKPSSIIAHAAGSGTPPSVTALLSKIRTPMLRFVLAHPVVGDRDVDDRLWAYRIGRIVGHGEAGEGVPRSGLTEKISQ